MDPETGEEVFLTWKEVEETCREVQAAPAELTGKDYYKNDPTYNLRRKK